MRPRHHSKFLKLHEKKNNLNWRKISPVLVLGTGAGAQLLLVYNEERDYNEDYNEDKHINTSSLVV